MQRRLAVLITSLNVRAMLEEDAHEGFIPAGDGEMQRGATAARAIAVDIVACADTCTPAARATATVSRLYCGGTVENRRKTKGGIPRLMNR